MSIVYSKAHTESLIKKTIPDESVSQLYLVNYDGTPIGHTVKSLSVTDDGIKITNELTFRISQGRVRRSSETQLFESKWPFRLTQAQHENGFEAESPTIRLTVKGMHIPAESTGERRLNEPFGYVNTRFFQRNSRPHVDTFEPKSIDYRLGQVVASDWLGKHADATSDTSALNNPHDSSIGRFERFDTMRKTIDPINVSLIRVATLSEASAWRKVEPILPTGAIKIHTKGSPDNIANLSYLKLRFSFQQTIDSNWRDVLDASSVMVLDMRANTSIESNSVVPSNDPTANQISPSLLGLVQLLQPTQNNQELISQLVRIVRDHITYVDTKIELDLDDIVASGIGDCSEHAELFKQLAAATGFEAKVINGLVYEKSSRTFRPHAWNTVAVDGEWHGVDPTLGHSRLNPGYIPFPSENTVAMIRSLRGLTIEFIEAG